MARVAGALVAVVAVLVTLGCGAAEEPAPPAPVALQSSGTGTVEVGGRPVTVHVPESYDPEKAAPLVVLLHGYSSDAREQESYFKLTPESDRRGFIYAYPDGTVDSRGDRFWNATDACCGFYGPEPEDSAYLSELLTSIQAAYRIAPARVYL